jgi:zinc transport system permease protein
VKNKKNSWLKAVFNILVAVFVAGSLKVIGGLLVSGLLIIAVLASQFVNGGFLRSTFSAILINSVCVFAGIGISYYVDVSASAAIILSLIASYGVLGLVRSNR